MIIAPRRHKHPSSGANRPSDVAVIENINDEFNLMAVNHIIECVSRDLICEYCHGLEFSTIYTAPTIFVEYIHVRSNRSLPHLPLQMHTEEIIPTFLTSNIHVGVFLPKALTLTWL